jgi:hypothetical protein
LVFSAGGNKNLLELLYVSTIDILGGGELMLECSIYRGGGNIQCNKENLSNKREDLSFLRNVLLFRPIHVY